MDHQTADDIISKSMEFLGEENFGAAIDELTLGLQLHPHHPRMLYMKGCAHAGRGDVNEAISAYRESAKYAGEMAANPLYNLANLYRDLNDVSNAIDCYKMTIAINPNCSDAWINMGSILDDNGQSQAALECYEAALLIDTEDHITWSNRGNSLRTLGRYEEAENSFGKAIALNENDLAAQIGIAVCRAHRGDESCIAILEATYSKTRDQRVLFELATVLAKFGRHEDALECYDLLVEQGMDEAAMWNNRGECLARLHRVEDSLASFDAAIVANREYLPAYFGKARVLVGAGRRPEAKNLVITMLQFASEEFVAEPAVQALISLVRAE